jgi:tetratricopeptide (TPR) repeat protein
MMLNRIAKPLGMVETKIVFNEQMKKNLAMPYSNGVQVSNWDLPTLAGAGAIRSSAFDMLRYVAANMGLQKSSLLPAVQLSQQARHDKAGEGTRVGLGWFISKGAEGDVIWHNGGTGGYRTFAGFVKETGIGVVVMTNSDKGVDDIGMRLLNSTSQLLAVKKSAIDAIEKTMQSKGVRDGLQTYAALKKDKGEYAFDEDAINAVGYSFLRKGKLAEAIAVFKINVDEFPTSFNVYDSYAEALMTDGQKEAAIINYKKSLELNPGNTNATDMMAKMNGAAAPKDVTVAESVLASYAGVYELAPEFTITVTHTGKQLFGQATGQESFELFATSNTEFYLKVVPAKIVFSVKDGKAESLTLFQGGKEMPGKKIN